MKNPNTFVLSNNKKRKRYLVQHNAQSYASALHCAEALAIPVNSIYKAVNSFLSLNTAYNTRPLVRRHFNVEGYKLWITIHNVQYDNQ